MTYKKKIPKLVKLQFKMMQLQDELFEANETLRAIRSGEVDALVVNGKNGDQIFTLKNADQPYRILVETMNEGAATLDNEGSIFYCNKRFADVLATQMDAIIGTSIFQFIKFDEQKKFQEVFSNGKNGISSGTFLFENKLGSSVPLYISMSYAEIDGKEGVCIIATDLTQQIRFKEYEVLAKELEKAVIARDEFISIASHELKTPLTTLMLQSQMQNRWISKNDPRAYGETRVKAIAEQTERMAEKLNRLIEDMLDISRIKTGKISIHKEDIDLAKLTEEILERMQPQFISSGSGIPIANLSPALGKWDVLRIEQVITNLFNNAIKYGRGLPIEVTVCANENFARISIKDQGIGIPKEEQHKIFGQFERTANSGSISGLGLGLYISQQIVEAHGGKISVESIKGIGSTFTVELPIYPN